MKPLASWTRDLVMRMDQLEKWATTAHPPTIFWMSGFTFPTGFLTAILQVKAENHQIFIKQNNHLLPINCLCCVRRNGNIEVPSAI